MQNRCECSVQICSSPCSKFGEVFVITFAFQGEGNDAPMQMLWSLWSDSGKGDVSRRRSRASKVADRMSIGGKVGLVEVLTGIANLYDPSGKWGEAGLVVLSTTKS